MPVGIWDLDWPSALVAHRILRTLLREVMGYEAEFAGVSSVAAEALYALAGCLRPDRYMTNAECYTPERRHSAHIALEVWDSSRGEGWEDEMYNILAPTRLVSYGSMGYTGFETIFTPESAWLKMLQAEGVPLDFYRSYNSSWHDPSLYFSKYWDIPLTELRPCSESILASSALVQTYFDHTGDEQGVEWTGDRAAARCWNQSWWLAPSCRNNPDKCVPLITGGKGWLMYFILQAATSWNMPWAVAVSSDFETYQSIPKEHTVLHYWWTPDTSFIDASPLQIAFPAAERTPWISGAASDLMRPTDLLKYTSKELQEAAPQIAYVVSNFILSPKEVDDMLYELKVHNKTAEEVACAWVRQNKEIWREWIPKGDICVHGQGFSYEGSGEFVAAAEAKNTTELLRCKWCPPGRYSLHGGKHTNQDDTLVCSLCEAGTYSMEPGKTRCTTCRRGTYASAEGLTRCETCEQGRYQAVEGSSVCEKCPGIMTTLFPGGEDLSVCVCPEGTYAVAGIADANATLRCAACPEGMRCDVGAAEANVPCSAEGVEPPPSSVATIPAFPKPANGYWVGCNDPLVAFRCIDVQECPGSWPESCAHERREGIACGRCEPGFARSWPNRFTCLPCGSAQGETSAWMAGIILSLVALVLVLHFLAADGAGEWIRPQITLPSLAYVVLVFLQMLAIYVSTDIVVPEGLPMATYLSDTLRDVDHILERLCIFAHLEPFSKLWIEVTAPLQVMSIFYLVYITVNGTAMSLGIDRRMDMSVGISNFGSLFSTFFICVARRAFSILDCYKHPGNAGWSVRGSPDMLCYSPEWESMIAPMVAGLVICCGGPLALLCFVMRRAPRCSQDEHFLRRWRFLFFGFRPSAWWWSVVLLLKGILCSASGALVEGSLQQLLLLETIVLIYTVWCAVIQPWKCAGITIADVVASACLFCMGSVFARFSRRGTSQSETDELYLTPLLVPFALPFVCACLVSAILAMQLVCGPVANEHYARLGQNLAKVCEAVDPDELAEVLKTLPWVDLMQLRAGVNIMEQEVTLRRRLLRTCRASGASVQPATLKAWGQGMRLQVSEQENGVHADVPWSVALGYKLSLRSRLIFFEATQRSQVFPSGTARASTSSATAADPEGPFIENVLSDTPTQATVGVGADGPFIEAVLSDAPTQATVGVGADPNVNDPG